MTFETASKARRPSKSTNLVRGRDGFGVRGRNRVGVGGRDRGRVRVGVAVRSRVGVGVRARVWPESTNCTVTRMAIEMHLGWVWVRVRVKKLGLGN